VFAGRGLLRGHRFGNHHAAIKIIDMQHGVFGSVSNSDELIRSLG
jgi:hypothetical protein